jgi:hypothetical protein
VRGDVGARRSTGAPVTTGAPITDRTALDQVAASGLHGLAFVDLHELDEPRHRHEERRVRRRVRPRRPGPGRRYGLDVLREFRLLSYNAFLLHIRVPPRSWGHEVMAAPAYRDRARELGVAVADGYDAVALMEVFDEDEQAAVLDAWSARPAAHVLGPGPSWLRKSSGLVTIVDGPRLSRTAQHRFVARGSPLHDADVLTSRSTCTSPSARCPDRRPDRIAETGSRASRSGRSARRCRPRR